MIAGVPYDAEVEYLSFNNKQYIDTGFRANTATTRFECKLEPLDASKNRGLFGSRNVASAAGFSSCNVFVTSNEGGAFRLDWYNGDNTAYAPFTIGQAYEISITRGLAIINGESVELGYVNPSSVDQSYNFLIGNFSNGSVAPYLTGFIGRYFWARLYSHGILVHDYIPVRVGTVGYMYDRVTRRLLGNSGTGALGFGPDAATPVMGIHRYARPRAVLPEGARRLAYLESDGAQWIDTGFKANTTTTRLECKIVPLSTAQNQGLCGSRNVVNVANGQSCNLFVVGSGVFRLDWPQGGNVATAPIETGKPYEMSITRGSAVINGESIRLGYVNPESADQFGNFLVGNFSNGTLPFSTGFIGRWMWARLYSHGTLVRDFVPIAIGSTGYMYDAENEKIYPNAGSGAFALGEIGGEA